MKSRLLVALIVGLFSLPSLLRAVDMEGFEGFWRTIDDKTGQVRSIVKLERQGDQLLGFIQEVVPEPGKPANPICEKGPKRFVGQPVKGMNFMWGFLYRGDRLSDGQVFDPEQGKVYHCRLELLEGGRKLKLFGYIKLIVKIGRSQVWERVE